MLEQTPLMIGRQIELRGPDALAFIERITLRRVKVEWDFNATLCRKGRWEHVFVSKREGEDVLLIAIASREGSLFETLEKNHFSEDLELFKDDIGEDDYKSLIHELGVVKLGALPTWINELGPVSGQTKGEQGTLLSRARACGLNVKGVPVTHAEFTLHFWRYVLDALLTPLQSGHEGFVDWEKGCFPGQEVLGRQEVKGRTKKRLVWFKDDLEAMGDASGQNSTSKSDLAFTLSDFVYWLGLSVGTQSPDNVKTHQ